MSGIALLNPSDPDPVQSICNPSHTSPFLLVGDHAGTAIPQRLGDLGLSAEDRARHIFVDLGVERLGRLMSERLKAPFVWQAYSRLVVDCNRKPATRDWAAPISDGTRIPGNCDLSEGDLAARHDEIFEPYHAAIADMIDRRTKRGIETILISLHSFTPQMQGKRRPWELCVLHDGARYAFAKDVLAHLQTGDRVIGDNEPYRMDETDYTVPRHAFARGLRYAEIEVRQDIVLDETETVVALLADAFEAAARDAEKR
ncbi:N-formylglutamate amidohydrolase [Aurantiacibacter hainanensis]|uniref:N-formylglutamate amidohydrolase n=1 Tax=Aurantiacibacter hainanensis TaxID=3076114 RepID=UPI0030C69CFE